MRKLDYFWKSKKEWYHRKENGVCVLNDNAPIEAQESYKHYHEQEKRAEQEIKEGKSLD